MKRLMRFCGKSFSVLLLFAGLTVSSCYDDSDLRKQLEDLSGQLKDYESRLKELERLAAQQNTNIASLQTIVSALQEKDYVTNVAPINEGNKVMGYTITFSKSGTITIYNGEDGYAPEMGVRQAADNLWYWTVDGEWLIDSNGNMIRASAEDGKDGQVGTTPKLKIVEGYWYVSYDDGNTWENEPLGQATGDAGHTMFAEVAYDDEFVYITMASGEALILPRASLGQDIISATDLSLLETANCYIVSASGSYKFKAVKGNSKGFAGSVASVEVLWETFGTDITPNIGDLIKSVYYKASYVVFQTADTFKEGNAVIAAKDADGNILWSWHIWFTDEPVGQDYYNNAGTIMDRNLGATSATPGDVGALGLLYQWGRKDPFLGSSSISKMSVVESTITWPSSVKADSSIGTIEYATAHPTTFINSSINYDWYYTGTLSVDNTRWTTSDKAKTIYDPCPAGWRVPDGGENGIWSKALGSSSSFKPTFDETSRGINFSGKFGSVSTIWYPATGYRSRSGGSPEEVGVTGGWWSASLDDDKSDGYGAYELYFYAYGYIYPSSTSYRAEGHSVRCIRE